MESSPLELDLKDKLKERGVKVVNVNLYRVR